MLKKGFKANPHNITEQQMQYFADKTEGYSGSDIAILVKDAVYQPIRKLQAATKFRRVGQKLTPCEDTATGPDVIQSTLMSIPADQLEVPIITAADLDNALKKTKASVDKAQLKEYEVFTSSFGQDG